MEDAGLQVHGESFFLGKDIPFSLTEEGGARFPHIIPPWMEDGIS